ncbi:hypothetical protein L2E82_06532 [Cichorium intybus]|uniref:Uncharacterized protein n=2 Tax=Cichorium intybus TaxID=13427 RepID=A0ACB9HA83_CICIN|nr:hypothetical protein L2E82_06531 [Cichorium intybus]KAI3792645.1 hypothetical protein L2E82_06532 [Cichorium intybus]
MPSKHPSTGQVVGEKSSRQKSPSSPRLQLSSYIELTCIWVVSKMVGGRVAHPVLKGPSVVKELVIGSVLGLAAGGLWKMHHWNEQRKTRAFYDLLEKGEISVVVEESTF